jgi:hypothetical protein
VGKMKKGIGYLIIICLLPFLFSCSGGGSSSSGGGSSSLGGGNGNGNGNGESYLTGFVELQGQADHSGAIVYLEEGSTYSSMTTSTGYYMIDNVPDGTYIPVAKKDGYQTKVWDGAPLTFPGEHTGVNFSLQPV